MPTTDLLIAGGGLAAISVIRALRDAGDGRSIAVIAGEAGEPYDRPPLSKQILTGAASSDQIALVRQGEWGDLNVTWLAATAATALDPSALSISVSDGDVWLSDDIVIATGARPRPLPAPLEAPGVLELRTLDDALRLRDGLGPGRRVVVVGAGFIGLEVASSAVERGCEVTVVEAAPVPLARVLGDEVGAWFADLHERAGVRILCSASVASIDGRADRPLSVALGDGTVLTADVVVVGIGVVPDTAWLDGSGLSIEDGVLCDGLGRTSRPHVWAAGDVARWPHPMTGEPARIEQWQSAVEQGRIVGAALAGREVDGNQVPYFWSDQHGHKLQFAGRVGSGHEMHSLGADSLAVIFHDGDVACGLLVVDRPRLLALGRRALADRASLAEVRELLG